MPNKINKTVQDSIKFGNKIVRDKDIAENFNAYFVNSIADIVQGIKKFNNRATILNNITTHEKLEAFQKTIYDH